MSTAVKRHKVDVGYCTWQLDDHRKALVEDVADACADPNNLSILASNAMALASYASVADPCAVDINSSLRIAGQALAAHFKVAVHSSLPVECELAGKNTRFEGVVDESKVEATKWLNAYWLSLIFADTVAIEQLCQVPMSMLRNSTTKHPEHRYLLIESLISFWHEYDETGSLLLQAMRATDPEQGDVKKSWVLHIDVPLIHAVTHAVSEDGRFSNTLKEGVKKHKKYWSATTSRKDDWEGFLSIGLSGAAKLAFESGLNVGIVSDYLINDKSS
ncbi:immunity 49 family protein [Thalassoglobus polymorphus]|uniref:Uncharacterized protein n=1 Tax=Thalassoglobus polymorphus TaxID=2527994 RepID=A0A517QL68_9PLAN|nr:immunity 49 family protein [Thalassoglobus polymorphus]QDT32379.1 hypothetical protein Mal48_16250 [Thalassoglobus polymorphus]